MVEPDMVTCCWMAALARAAGLEYWEAYWVTRALEVRWRGVAAQG